MKQRGETTRMPKAQAKLVHWPTDQRGKHRSASAQLPGPTSSTSVREGGARHGRVCGGPTMAGRERSGIRCAAPNLAASNFSGPCSAASDLPRHRRPRRGPRGLQVARDGLRGVGRTRRVRRGGRRPPAP